MQIRNMLLALTLFPGLSFANVDTVKANLAKQSQPEN